MSRAIRASDGVELHYLRWCSGRSPPWAVVVFLHGIASHGGWFAETAADLDTQGVAVYAPPPAGRPSSAWSTPRCDPRRCPGCCCSARGDHALLWETARLDRGRWRAAAGLRLPLLLLQGEDDAMMEVAGTRHWFSRLGVEDKTYRAYPGAGHTLDFQPDPAGTWPTWSDGCRLGSHRRRRRRRAVVPRCRR